MEMKTLLGTFLVLIVMLALVPVFAASLADAKYGLKDTEYFTKAPNGTTKDCSLLGNIRNETAFITVTVTNTTNTYTWTDYLVTGLGSYAANSTLQVKGLLATSTYTAIVVTYSYLIPSAQVTLLNLLPLLYVIILLVAIAVVIIKMLDKTKT